MCAMIFPIKAGGSPLALSSVVGFSGKSSLWISARSSGRASSTAWVSRSTASCFEIVAMFVLLRQFMGRRNCHFLLYLTEELPPTRCIPLQWLHLGVIHGIAIMAT